MVEMMKERTDMINKRPPTSSSSSSSSSSTKSDQEVKAKLQEMEENFRRLENVKGLDARIIEVEARILIFIINIFV